MNFYLRLISASPRIKDTRVRGLAEILSGCLLTKQIPLLTMLGLSWAETGQPDISLFLASISSLFCYGLSRTQWYKPAAYVAIADPMIFISLVAWIHPEIIIVKPQMSLALIMGPLIASLTLSTRATVISVAATLGVLINFSLRAIPAPTLILCEQSIMIFVVSLFALIGSYLRDRAQNELEKERAKVIQSSKLAAIGEMASGMAHELNSPLGAIILNAELVEELVENGEKHSISAQLNEIITTADRMSRIITGLKNFSRESSDEDLINVKVKNWIDDALNLCRKKFEVNNISLDFEIDDPDLSTWARPVQMTQVVLNLLNNCFDAVTCLDEKWVSLKVHSVGDRVELKVIDSGKGVQKDMVEKIFQPFATTKDYGAGTGLGLSVSLGLMKAQGGDLTYQSGSSNTTFVMTFPLFAQKSNESVRISA